MKKTEKYFGALACAVALTLTGCTTSDNLSVSENESVQEVVSEQETIVTTTAEESAATEVSSEAETLHETAETDSSNPAEELPPENPEPEYVAFFKENKVHELNIEIDPAQWNAMVSNPYSKEPRHADITIDGVTMKDAAIHPRGVTSLNYGVAYGTRLPYKIKFDKFVDDGNFLGLDEITLENSACDPSTLRQYAGMEAMRALGVNSPYVTFFNVYVNGTLHGFYAGIEAVDSSYLERVFGSHKHNLYKAESGATLTTYMSMDAYTQKKGSDESKSDIKELVRIIDETPLGEKGSLEEIIDVDLFLRSLAADAVIHNWDNYAGETCHNFYLYMEDGTFRYIPWDMNETFLQTESGERPGAGSKQDIISPITGYVAEADRPLVRKIMAVEEYYSRYIDYCEECMNWLYGFYETKLPELEALVTEHYEKDPTKFYKFSAFQSQFDETNRDGITGFIKERCEYLSARIPEIRQEKGLDKQADE